MSTNLDMSLEDIIKQNKKSGGGDKRGGGANPSSRVKPARNSGPGPTRRIPNRSANRATPYGLGQVEAPETVWKHDMYAEQAAAYPAARGGGGGGGGRVSAIETGTKLIISNLDYGVSDDDIKELFSEAGDLKRFSIHYDRSGRSKGTAEVVYSRRRDAESAVKKYHNVQLDGKPMKIEIVGTNVATHTARPQNGAPKSQGRVGAFGRLTGGMAGGGGGGGGGSFSGVRGGGGRGSRRNPGRGGKGGGRGEKKVVVSAEDLDADLEKYHSEAMQTN